MNEKVHHNQNFLVSVTVGGNIGGRGSFSNQGASSANISKSLSAQKITNLNSTLQAGCERYKRSSLTSIASGYKFRSEYVRESVSALYQQTGVNINIKHSNMNNSTDKLGLPEVQCRRYSLPTNELIDEYKLNRQSKKRERSDSIGVSIMNLLRPGSRDESRRSSCTNMRGAGSCSNNLQIPRKKQYDDRRNSATGCHERRRSSAMNSLLDIRGRTSCAESRNQSRRTSMADFMENFVGKSSMERGMDSNNEQQGKEGKTSLFQSLIISQQDKEENRRKVKKLSISVIVFSDKLHLFSIF